MTTKRKPIFHLELSGEFSLMDGSWIFIDWGIVTTILVVLSLYIWAAGGPKYPPSPMLPLDYLMMLFSRFLARRLYPGRFK